ncbi:HTTM domain-containing protein [Pseudoclavibacter endophyticus]|uniref:HTTM domain-containing protein n=2 Tax=Pseudoclavibacter endophyticus TaxID=1778590 RepID=A0A6H9WWA0_9MICO|nr:HTTM domain-containing protein [Pseudoclavibacter endophyticus]
MTVFTFVERWLVDAKHARYGFAVTRILVGATGLGLLAANFTTRLYTFGSGSAWNGEAAAPRSEFPNIWIFSLFNRIALNDVLFTICYVLLAVLAVLVLVGWRKRFVLPVYFVGWVSFIEMNDLVGDQGDNMYRITLLTLLFTDCASRWSLDARRRRRQRGERRSPNFLRELWNGDALVPAWLTNPVHNLALVTLTAQVSFIYVSGALYKAAGTTWQNGTAIYAPLQTQRFGPWPELNELVVAWPPVLAALAWGSILLQLSFPFMLLRRPTRIIALVGICGFHVGIAVLMGLPWFSLAMIAVDAVFVRDSTWRGFGERLKRAWQEGRARAAGAPATRDAAPGDADQPPELENVEHPDPDDLDDDPAADELDERRARDEFDGDEFADEDPAEGDPDEGGPERAGSGAERPVTSGGGNRGSRS